MSQTQVLKIAGLYTQANRLSSVPDGALKIADDIVIDRDNEAESRRGFERLEFQLSDVADRAKKIFSYQSKLLIHDSNNKLSYYDSSTGLVFKTGTFEQIGTLSKIRSVEANNNFYFTTNSGIKMLDKYDGEVMATGMPKSLDGEGVLSGATGFLANDSMVSYCVVWGFKDANNNIVLSAPSQRINVANSSGGTRNVDITITIPASISTSDFFQVYRSAQSAGASIEPNDEMQLVYEANPTSGEITAKSLTFTDITIDDLKGAFLYTSPSQEGIAQANNEPPLAKDIASFKNCLFYANVKSKQRLFLTVMAVGGTNGIQLDDTLTIAGTVYTAKASETIASKEYKLYTAGTPSQNIADTTRSLVRVINRNSTNTLVYAYYLSGYNDLPGKILLESREINASVFSVIASAHGGAFNPSLPTSGTTVSSSNDEYKNGIYISKTLQGEAVPLVNLVFLGSSSKEILRVISLRDAILIFKEDGIFRGTGTTPQNFQFELFDNSTILLCPESAVVLNNTVFCFTTQGIVSVSDSGVNVVSRPIENDLIDLIGMNYATLKSESFGVSYESERKYIFFTISDLADSYPTCAFVFNTFTNAWTKWSLKKTCGIVNPSDDKLYLANAENKYLTVERKSKTYTDYIDEGDIYNISSIDGKKLILVESVTLISVGDLFYQTASLNSVISAVNYATNEVTVMDLMDFTVAACTVYKSIPCQIEWSENAAGNPAVQKLFRELEVFFKQTLFPSFIIYFNSDLSGSNEETTIVNNIGSSRWGLFPFGEAPWGGFQRSKSFRTYVPRNKSRASQLTVGFKIQNAFSKFIISGFALQFTFVSEKNSR